MSSGGIFSVKYANNYTEDDLTNIFNKNKFNFNLSVEIIDYIKYLLNNNYGKIITNEDYNNIFSNTKYNFRKEHIIKAYRYLLLNKMVLKDRNLEEIIVKKKTRGHSGVAVVTIFTSPIQFGDGEQIKTGGCPMDCYFCPFEKNTPFYSLYFGYYDIIHSIWNVHYSIISISLPLS